MNIDNAPAVKLDESKDGNLDAVVAADAAGVGAGAGAVASVGVSSMKAGWSNSSSLSFVSTSVECFVRLKSSNEWEVASSHTGSSIDIGTPSPKPSMPLPGIGTIADRGTPSADEAPPASDNEELVAAMLLPGGVIVTAGGSKVVGQISLVVRERRFWWTL